MMLDRFLSRIDADRGLRCFQKLARHDIAGWALTGGLAIELHHLLAGREADPRVLNDIDFIVGSFDRIPQTLADDFLFRHVHPFDPPGKTLMQAIDADTCLRVDVFRAFGETMRRTISMDLPAGRLHLISLEDLVARTARLALDLAGGVPTPAKHAVDFLRLMELAGPADIETAWRDQRKPQQPASFDEAASVLERLIPSRKDMLIYPDYSRDATEICGRCAPTAAFPLAEPTAVLAVLGYC
jgi:hypothetical protein